MKVYELMSYLSDFSAGSDIKISGLFSGEEFVAKVNIEDNLFSMEYEIDEISADNGDCCLSLRRK